MIDSSDLSVGAVILGAGMSTRMGSPKLLLPWSNQTVIETILDTLQNAGISTQILVTGASHDELNEKLSKQEVYLVFNPDYADGNMVHSLQVGLRALQLMGYTSALLALGDQPQMQVATVESVIKAAMLHPDRLILPSYHMKRGHPWIIPSTMWDDIFSLEEDQTMRDFVRRHEDHIHYVLVETDTIFADLDTPEEYQREKPTGN